MPNRCAGLGWLIWLACGLDATAADEAAAARPMPPTTYRRTAFLGDSITDGNTYPQLIRSAIKSAKLPAMVAINAGVGSDTAAMMAARLDRDVLAARPTLVTFNAGANDAFRGVTPAQFEKSVREVAARLRRERIPLILLTPNILGGEKKAKAGGTIARYDAALRRVASDYGLRLGEVGRRQEEAVAAGKTVLEADDLHPNYEGQRLIARAVLDVLGYPEVPVPDRVGAEPLPGVVSPWKFRPLGPDERENTRIRQRVDRLRPDASWVTVTLPEPGPAEPAWLDDFRQQGGSMSLKKAVGGRGRYLGLATIGSKQRQAVQVHTGAELLRAWLNGRLIYEAKDWRGWHPGRQSVPAELRAGTNTLVIETGPTFFLSITNGPIWADSGP